LTRTRACGELRSALGVYVLGAMVPADRDAVESHLASCVDCRDQLADLAGLPALLHRIPLDEAESLVERGDADHDDAVSERLLASLLSQAAKRRRRRLWPSSLAVAATVALAAGAATAYAALGPPPPRSAAAALQGAITVRGSNPRDHASATVTYVGRPWGVQLSVQVNGIAAGTRCVLEVTDASGAESQAGSWTVAAGAGSSWYWASTSVPLTSVRAFVVTTGAQPLVRVGVPFTPARATSGRFSQ
jgi:hypothetical protein